ncbi:GNAT family N-acetyltransferase [Microbacterium marinilacus]|uniref:GNAT family N-acetyltransferase n=1 Tax=Microbacterium marinilacus TaxID=415209 RepID=UPI001C8EE4EC|nr:GNAT family N-acetyltransferase [Microbacterium marinilacus]MBY0689918.1 GNAT family N-acetyltransferase [Microbacterium marinilacus]
MTSIHAAPVSEIPPLTLYEILRLRVDVFVVEQECPYPELDGRDVEPTALHLWATDGDRVVATVRLLHDPEGRGEDRRIGRVATAPDARGRGVAGELMRRALELCADRPADDTAAPAARTVRLDAQSHLSGWYGRFGFTTDGPEFLEDGIPHVPMVRTV